MNLKSIIACGLAAAVTIVVAASTAVAGTPLGTAIAYERSGMRINTKLLDGRYDMRFTLWDSATGGTMIGPTLNKDDVRVDKGVLASQVLDFGSEAFGGEERWIETRARQGSGSYKVVGARHRIRTVPYALGLPGLYTIPNATSPNIVGGHTDNKVADGVIGATISGGGSAIYANKVHDDYGTVGGGQWNTAGSIYSTVGGGSENTANGLYSTVSGGEYNRAGGYAASISGGQWNVAGGSYAVISGGGDNFANGYYSTISGGSESSATGQFATVPGGRENTAAGHYGFAAGRRAKADHSGSFVWGDATDDDVASSAGNQFIARASGGVQFFDATGVGVELAPGGNSWSAMSDRAAKEDLADVDPVEVLRKLVAMPVTTWKLISQDESIRHIGPMAQDFHAAFGVGEDDRRITQTDADGVLFAAVQGLHRIVSEKDARLAQQDSEIAALKALVLEMSSRMERLESMIEGPASQSADMAAR